MRGVASEGIHTRPGRGEGLRPARRARACLFVAAASLIACESLVAPAIEGALAGPIKGVLAGIVEAILVGMALYVLLYRPLAVALHRQVRSERNLQAVLDTAADGIVIADDKGTILSINPAAQNLFGYNESELAGQNVSMLMGEPDRSLHNRHMTRYLRERKPRVIGIGREVRGRRGDGSFVPLDLAMSEMTVGGRTMFTAFVRDISVRKEFERQLAEARDQELKIGGAIQRTLLRAEMPSHMPGLDVYGLTRASEHVDGDFYDYFQAGEHVLDLVLGDVMGKGVPAALLAAATKTHFIRSISDLTGQRPDRSAPSPEQVVQAVHHRLSDRLMELESFVTVFYARIDRDANQLTFVDAGHTSTLCYRAATDEIVSLQGRNVPLGFMAEECYRQHETSFSPGDVLVCYSDGVTEARNPHGEAFGLDRLAECLRDRPDGSAAEIGSEIRAVLSRFMDGQSTTDDVTCVVIRAVPESMQRPLAETESDFRAESAQLDQMRTFCRIAGQRLLPQWAGGAMEKLILAVHEVASNAISHACGETGGRISLRLRMFDDRIEADVEHDGALFRPGQVQTPSFDGSRERGFGLYIVQNVVDQVDYQQTAPGRCRTTLVKRFAMEIPS